MKIADLYIRVSTDEQADKGYSQRNQEEVLRKYCAFHNIQIRKIIFEDHSAKTFNRPAWNTLLADLKKTKGRFSDLVLFTKWDRFSRNAGDAYQMISTLNNYGIEPQAIEQSLDLSVPENKLMLAIYLSTPEVENDRRALNVLHGMRRARKEGRWMASAPIGYKNATTENGKKMIVPKEPEASIIKFSFEKIATSQFSTEQIWKTAKENGLKCGKNNFLLAMRNPVYCGKITVPKYKDEELHIVQGLHEPLVSEHLFYEVQDVMDGRKRQQGTKFVSIDQLPLRGYLLCSKCSRVLTGSASKGRKAYYYYYHCSSQCGCRYKAEEVNDIFLSEIKRYAPKPGLEELCKEIILDVYHRDYESKGDGRKQLIARIDELTSRQKKARELLLNGDLDGIEYREIKSECESKINALEAKISDLSITIPRIDDDLNRAIAALSSINGLVSLEDDKLNRELVGSMFPEKFTFENLIDRTARVNEIAEIIWQINNRLQEKKQRARDENSSLPSWVRPPGLHLYLYFILIINYLRGEQKAWWSFWGTTSPLLQK